MDDFLALFDVCAFHADDHGNFELELTRGVHDAGCQNVAAQDAAEDVDEDGANAGIADEDFERVLDLLSVCAAAASSFEATSLIFRETCVEMTKPSPNASRNPAGMRIQETSAATWEVCPAFWDQATASWR